MHPVERVIKLQDKTLIRNIIACLGFEVLSVVVMMCFYFGVLHPVVRTLSRLL
jgi:hypothetical protein